MSKFDPCGLGFSINIGVMIWGNIGVVIWGNVGVGVMIWGIASFNIGVGV